MGLGRGRKGSRRSCIVIGAGLAGLSAAYELRKAGWNVEVLEALPKPGGRVLSHRFDDAPELVCELGAEWIGEDHHRIRRLCRSFGLRLQSHRFSYRFWNGVKTSRAYQPASWPFSRRARSRFRSFGRKFRNKQFDELQKRELDQMDWSTLLRSLGFTDQDIARRDLMDSTDFGESIRLSSAYLAATEYFDSNDTDEMDFKVVGGNDRLVWALVAAIGQKHVWTKSQVSEVFQDAYGVEIKVRGRTTPFNAEFCICTIPANGLRNITWQPALALSQQTAASQLQYSRIMKTAVLYPSRFWPTNRRYGFSVFTNRASDFCFESTFGQRGPAGILCSYAIGDKADDIASEPSRDKVMKWITDDVITAIQADPTLMMMPWALEPKAWQQQKWIHGAYAFFRPGQWYQIREQLGAPHASVLFAGEHLSAEWQGFMEGAVETGQEAARKLIRFAP